MICKPCALGADLITHFDKKANSKTATSLAKILHQDCKGHTHCDCQHRLYVEVGIAG